MSPAPGRPGWHQVCSQIAGEGVSVDKPPTKMDTLRERIRQASIRALKEHEEKRQRGQPSWEAQRRDNNWRWTDAEDQTDDSPTFGKSFLKDKPREVNQEEKDQQPQQQSFIERAVNLKEIRRRTRASTVGGLPSVPSRGNRSRSPPLKCFALRRPFPPEERKGKTTEVSSDKIKPDDIKTNKENRPCCCATRASNGELLHFTSAAMLILVCLLLLPLQCYAEEMRVKRSVDKIMLAYDCSRPTNVQDRALDINRLNCAEDTAPISHTCLLYTSPSPRD